MSDKELLLLLAKGDERAYEFLFKQFYRPLSLFANRYVDDIDQAKDIVQEVFFQLFEKRETITIHTSLKSFLYQMVRNRALNHIKMNKIHSDHHERILLTSSFEVVDSSEIEHSELEDKIAKIVSDLPNQTRRVFELSRYEGIPNQEIADSLEISKRTVETHISLALRKLREGLVDVIVTIVAFILLK